jgi:hypothetical protein
MSRLTTSAAEELDVEIPPTTSILKDPEKNNIKI